MNLRMTKNDIKKNFANIIMLDYAHYCELQGGLEALPKIGYNSGVYGWNSNIYLNTAPLAAIVAGYKPAGGHIRPSTELVERTAQLLADTSRDARHVMAEFVREALELNR